MRNYSQGFSIIEVMLSLTFGLFIITSCIEAYLAVKSNYQVQQHLSSMQANGRLLTYVFQQIKSPEKIHGYASSQPPPFLKGQKPISDILVTDNKQQTAYYITNTSLFVKTAGKPREELVTNITNMQIRYGVECPTSQDICAYLPASQVTNWGSVKSAEVTVRLKNQILQRSWSIYIAI